MDVTGGDIATGGGISGGIMLLVGFGRWALKLWAEVRREGFVTAKAATDQQRADGQLMVNALLESARSNTSLAGEMARSYTLLGGKIETLSGKLDTIAVWQDRERTPVEGVPYPHRGEPPSERRRREQQSGDRPPRPGRHHDDDNKK